jgi:dual specificity tyrosine-phosphorylation-regulated kinase 2/3/4
MGKPRLTVSSKGRRRRPSSKTLQQALKCDDEPFLDFLSKCLRWDPDKRMKPDEAIRHEFITGQKTSVPVPRMRDSSPSKRVGSIGSVPRPLPEPPAAAKASGSLRSRDASGVSTMSPLKQGVSASTSRRASGVSTTSTLAVGSGIKRISTGAPNYAPNYAATAGSIGSSGLPRASARSVSLKQDLAAAGASVAMGRRP